jgi:hypothetical protein
VNVGVIGRTYAIWTGKQLWTCISASEHGNDDNNELNNNARVLLP